MTTLRTTWKDSFTGLADDLLRGEGLWKGLRFLIAFLLLAGSLRSLQVFYGMVGQLTPEAVSVESPADVLLSDRERLERLNERFRVAVKARQGSGELSRLAMMSGRRPFAPVEAGLAGPIEIETVVDEVPAMIPPPLILVTAVMEMDQDRIAVADVEGHGGGLLLRPGFLLSGGKGRILSISAEKVVFLWEGERFEIPIGY
ncbi:MAG: hypothetical protein JMJ93_00080 [Synergistaceae bacterium]|nr:hypothetical protein [Synergistaceae bacterium]